MINRSNLLDAVLDNQDKSEAELIKAVEKVISEGIRFKHDASNVREACGVDKRNLDMHFLDKEYDCVSKKVEIFEETFSKRELTFILSMLERKVQALESHLKHPKK